MNPIVGEIKANLQAYYKQAETSAGVIERMKKELLPDLVSKRSELILSDLAAARYHVLDKIMDATRRGREQAKQWGILNGADLTDDAKILQAGMTLTQDDFDNLCKKYKNNGSMSRLLGEYAEKQNSKNDPMLTLETKNLMTVDKKVDRWISLEMSAKTILAAIDGQGVAQGVGDPIVSFSVENFGENVEV